MARISVEDLLISLKKKRADDFRKDIWKLINNDNLIEFVTRCSAYDLKVAAEWCKKDNVFLVHKIIEQVDTPSSLNFLTSRVFFDDLDQEKRTWLHIAVIFDRSLDILKFLITIKGISIESEDDYAYTPLHYYCQKEEYDIEILSILMKDQDQLTKQSKDGLTPLEFACSDQENLKVIRSVPLVEMKYLLKTIDNISAGVMEVEKYSPTSSFTIDRIWLNILQKNDKYMLLSYIKNDPNFIDKYFLDPSDILSIVRKCPENGQGILFYIKSRFFKASSNPRLHKILSGLTGIKIRKQENKLCFSRSALFLALVTGRFELISPLLRCCQFEIQSYAMMTCLICKNLATKKRFPDQVVKDILEVKEFCEEFAIAVMYRTYTRDLSDDKIVISEYINRKSDKLENKSIMQVAYHAKCNKYLSLPSCQESLTKIWEEKTMKCPRIKFWLHSLTHIVFLVLFSFVVASHIFVEIGAIECVCYIYGLGYLVEEVRQIYLSIKDDDLHAYYFDAANFIDICAILFMMIGFVLRTCLPLPTFHGNDDNRYFKESRNTSLFVLRLFLCLSLILFYMRMLYFASINRILGPKLKMISTMIVKDLIPLIFIFIIFLISFGVTFQSLLFPNSFYTNEGFSEHNVTFDKKNLVSTVSDIFRRATFTIFDFHYTLDEIENNRDDYVTDVNGRHALYFFLLVFMVIVDVMLMNLFIALLSNTVMDIIAKSKQSWKSDRYGFIKEYSNRSIAPPPFNIIEIPIAVLMSLTKANFMYQQMRLQKRNNNGEEPLQLMANDLESPEEPSMSYYIYQAFAMSGQRYRIRKDINDLEYEKEVHFKTMEDKLEACKTEFRHAMESRCTAMEKKILGQPKNKMYRNVCISVDLS